MDNNSSHKEIEREIERARMREQCYIQGRYCAKYMLLVLQFHYKDVKKLYKKGLVLNYSP